MSKLRIYRSSTGRGDTDYDQTFTLSDVTGDDYPIFLFTVGYSTMYVSAFIYLNRGVESNISYDVISSNSRQITSAVYNASSKTLTISLNNAIYRTGILLRLQ